MRMAKYNKGYDGLMRGFTKSDKNEKNSAAIPKHGFHMNTLLDNTLKF